MNVSKVVSEYYVRHEMPWTSHVNLHCVIGDVYYVTYLPPPPDDKELLPGSSINSHKHTSAQLCARAHTRPTYLVQYNVCC